MWTLKESVSGRSSNEDLLIKSSRSSNYFFGTISDHEFSIQTLEGFLRLPVPKFSFEKLRFWEKLCKSWKVTKFPQVEFWIRWKQGIKLLKERNSKGYQIKLINNCKNMQRTNKGYLKNKIKKLSSQVRWDKQFLKDFNSLILIHSNFYLPRIKWIMHWYESSPTARQMTNIYLRKFNRNILQVAPRKAY